MIFHNLTTDSGLSSIWLGRINLDNLEEAVETSLRGELIDSLVRYAA